MKLLIKLYKPDGTCEEVEDFCNDHEADAWNAECIISRLNERMGEIVSEGGRIEVAPIVE